MVKIAIGREPLLFLVLSVSLDLCLIEAPCVGYNFLFVFNCSTMMIQLSMFGYCPAGSVMCVFRLEFAFTDQTYRELRKTGLEFSFSIHFVVAISRKLIVPETLDMLFRCCAAPFLSTFINLLMCSSYSFNLLELR